LLHFHVLFYTISGFLQFIVCFKDINIWEPASKLIISVISLSHLILKGSCIWPLWKWMVSFLMSWRQIRNRSDNRKCRCCCHRHLRGPRKPPSLSPKPETIFFNNEVQTELPNNCFEWKGLFLVVFQESIDGEVEGYPHGKIWKKLSIKIQLNFKETRWHLHDLKKSFKLYSKANLTIFLQKYVECASVIDLEL